MKWSPLRFWLNLILTVVGVAAVVNYSVRGDWVGFGIGVLVAVSGGAQVALLLRARSQTSDVGPKKR